jgi:hypothetical protein
MVSVVDPGLFPSQNLDLFAGHGETVVIWRFGMGVRACSALFAIAFVPVLHAAQPSREQADDVLEATLKGVTGEFLTDEVRAGGVVACLQIDYGQGPQSISKDFLKRFRRLSFVRRGVDCEVRPEGAIEPATRAPAFVLTAGPISWVAADEAHVRVKYFRSNRDSGTRLYRVVRENSGWVSIGQIIKMAPS